MSSAPRLPSREINSNSARVADLRWSLTWLSDGRCIAATERALEVLTESGHTTPLVATGLEAPYCVVSDAHDRLFVSDQGGFPENPLAPNAALPQRAMRIGGHAAMQIKD